MIRTKIVATLGPAVSDPRTMRALLVAGVDVCRLNFSHGRLEEHASMLAIAREQADDLQCPVAFLADLGGPKIRLGEVADEDGSGGMRIEPGQPLVLRRKPVVGSGGVVSSTYPGLVDDVQVGHRVLIEDGLLRFVCIGKDTDHLQLQCSAGGVLKSRKGINLPNTSVRLPSITERDWECVAWAIEKELDYLSLSFMRRADELIQLRQHLNQHGARTQLIAKIEKAEALREIDTIIDAADGLMVARGDLGVEVDLAQVPIIQKDLVRRCRRAGKPVIVATQMLQSMVESSSPTRAEVSDIANAVFDGTDALMLSGETSVGRFPVGAVHTMAHVAEVTESYLQKRPYSGDLDAPGAALDWTEHRVSAAAAMAVRRLVEELQCRLVVVYSQTGETARLFARQRFGVPVVALSDDPHVLRRINLHYGVMPLPMPMPQDMAELVNQVDSFVQERELATVGDRIVMVAGRALGAPGSMNGILIHSVGVPEGIS
jgi:pyruvate kinase